MDMLDIANECMTLEAFIHMSPLQVQHSNPAEDHLFTVPGDDADAIVQRIMASTPEGNTRIPLSPFIRLTIPHGLRYVIHS